MVAIAKKSNRKVGRPDIANEMVRDYKVAIQACAGKNVQEIARELDCTRDTVYYALKKDRVKDYVEKHTLKMLENLPQAVKNVTGLVDRMEKETDKDERKLCYQATRDVLSVGNVLPSQNQTTLIQNVYNQQNNLIMSPIIKGMIDQHNKLMSFESVDAEVVNGPEEVREAQEG
jgi:uncharacterized protein (DUF433 family)